MRVWRPVASAFCARSNSPGPEQRRICTRNPSSASWKEPSRCSTPGSATAAERSLRRACRPHHRGALTPARPTVPVAHNAITSITSNTARSRARLDAAICDHSSRATTMGASAGWVGWRGPGTTELQRTGCSTLREYILSGSTGSSRKPALPKARSSTTLGQGRTCSRIPCGLGPAAAGPDCPAPAGAG